MCNVPSEFYETVLRILAAEKIDANVCKLDWGQTPLGQYFVFVTYQLAVLLIVDEEHRDLQIVDARNVYNDNVLLKQRFRNEKEARKYSAAMRKKMTEGSFKGVHVRIRKVPSDVYSNPDRYLKPGDHIQRDLGFPIPGNHEGVYLGEGRVAHINDKSSAADPSSVSTSKLSGDSYARIDGFDRFAGDRSKEIRVLVHCIRRKTPEAICEDARRLAKCEYRKGEYHVLKQNCQHFASLCVIGEEWMSDKEVIQKRAIAAGTITVGAAAVAALGYAAYKRSKKENKSTSPSSPDHTTE